MAFFLLTRVVDGLLVTPSTHGVTPSTHVARTHWPCMQETDWTKLSKSTALGASSICALCATHLTEWKNLPPASQSLVDAVKAGDVEFDTTMSAIEEGYALAEVAFEVGEQKNAAGTNMGSGKILSFGVLAGLNVEETLALFGKFYRDDVLGNPAGDDHANIRNFMKAGWEGVTFPDGLTISPKK